MPRGSQLVAKRDSSANRRHRKSRQQPALGAAPPEAPIFLDLHAKINDFLTIFTIKPYPKAWGLGELRTLETFKAFEFLSPNFRATPRLWYTATRHSTLQVS